MALTGVDRIIEVTCDSTLAKCFGLLLATFFIITFQCSFQSSQFSISRLSMIYNLPTLASFGPLRRSTQAARVLPNSEALLLRWPLNNWRRVFLLYSLILALLLFIGADFAQCSLCSLQRVLVSAVLR